MSVWDDMRALFPDNITGDIDALDMRDQVDYLEANDNLNLKTSELTDGSLTDIKIGGTDPNDSVATLADVLEGSPVFTDYVPGTAPAHQEGRLFYDSDDEALCYYNELTQMKVDIGKEMFVKVYNGSGTAIPNGTVVRVIGVFNEVPSVAPALADTYGNASILGVSTTDIANGGYGGVTTNGLVRDIDLSSYLGGTLLWLSDTVPGGLTDDPPDIPSFVGIVINNTNQGNLLVRTVSHKVLPTGIGWLEDLAGSYNITASPQLLTGYTSSDSVILTSNATTGTISVADVGVYRFTLNASVSYDSTASTRTLVFEVYNVTAAGVVGTFSAAIPRDSSEVSISFAVPGRVTLVPSSLAIRVRTGGTSADINNLSFDELSVDIESVAI